MWILIDVLIVVIMKGKRIRGGSFMSYILLHDNYVIVTTNG